MPTIHKNFKTKLFKIIILLAAVFSVLTFFFYHKHYQLNPSYLSGDEPHYIMMTDSLLKDGDFNLKNDYELHRSDAYFPVPNLYPQLSPIVDKSSSQWYPFHTVGLPILIANPYHFFGVLGVRIWMMALQVASVILFFLVLRRYIKSKVQQYVGLGLILLCPLFWQNLGSIFPDLLLVTLWLAVILLFPDKKRISNFALIVVAASACLIHSKAIVLFAPLVILNALWLIREDGFKQWSHRYWPSIAAAVLAGFASTYFLYVHYGIFLPSQLYGKSGQLFSANPLINSIAILTDRNKGLFVYFPILLVIGPYIVRAASDIVQFVRRSWGRSKLSSLSVNHYLFAGVLLGLALLLVTLLGFDDWSGSTAPNGRNMLPFIFLTIFLVAKYVDARNYVELTVLGAVSALCGWLSWLSISDFVYYMAPIGNSFWVDRFQPLLHLPMFGLFVRYDGREPIIRGIEILAVVLCFNFVLAVVYKYRISIKKR